MSSEEGSFLPTKSTKLWKKKHVKSKDWKPLTPNFCPCIDPETEKKCGNFMRNWDIMFYDQYGMCEECYLKFNDGKGVEIKDSDPEMETENDDD